MLKNGDAEAAIIFPPDFARQVAAGQNPTVQIVLEGSDPGVASAMRDRTEGFTHQLSVALSVASAQSTQGGQSTSPSPGSPVPLTVGSPQYLHGGHE